MDQLGSRPLAGLRKWLPEGAGDRRECGEARRHPAGEIPDHRATLREAARHQALRIDRKASRRIVEYLPDESELVPAPARRTRKRPAAAQPFRSDQRDAEPARHSGQGVVGDGFGGRALIAVEIHDGAVTLAGAAAGRDQDAVGAAGDAASALGRAWLRRRPGFLRRGDGCRRQGRKDGERNTGCGGHGLVSR